MKVFGIAGWSGSGKTTLLIKLVPVLVRQGIEVATVKHTHHDPSLGDADSRLLAAAGAVEIVVASPHRFALTHELGGRDEPPVEDLIDRFRGIDLLLIEGFKWASHPKLEVYDPAQGKPLLAVEAGNRVVALATDQPVAAAARLPKFARDDVEGIAAFVLAHVGL